MTTSSWISRRFFWFTRQSRMAHRPCGNNYVSCSHSRSPSGGQVSIVNRLDRETSGLVLVAKTAAAARDFGLLMQRHQLRKEYVAIVWGWPEWEHKIVDAPLDRQGKHQDSAIWLKQMIHPAGASAQTEFFVERCVYKTGIDRSVWFAWRLFDPHLHPLAGQGEEVAKQHVRVGEKKFALIRAIPRTGRTHQIRVHLSLTRSSNRRRQNLRP